MILAAVLPMVSAEILYRATDKEFALTKRLVKLLPVLSNRKYLIQLGIPIILIILFGSVSISLSIDRTVCYVVCSIFIGIIGGIAAGIMNMDQ